MPPPAAPTLEAPSHATDADLGPNGEVRFVSRDEAIRIRGALEAARLLVVSLADIGPGARGRLGEVIDDAIECALRERGGAPPGIGAASDADAALSDQLYRVRQIGRVGIALELGPLGALCDMRGSLEPDDAASLRFLATATRDRPVVLVLDEVNLTVRAYGPPAPLVDSLGVDPPRSEPRPKAAVPKPEAKPPPMRVAETRAVVEARPVEPPRLYVAVKRVDEVEGPSAASLSAAIDLLEEVTRATPLTGLERAFLEGYAPLRAAILDERLGIAGIGRAEARALCTAFATNFARAYGEALPTFGVTGRHPRMGFELFDLAQRCARIHGARSTHVVIVDALRWDLGKRLRERLAQSLARQAVCVEEQPMWSVLPTTTAVQLDALVRGEDALRAPIRPERETAIVRGRSLDVLRRMRLGHRDVVKLDLLEGRLREPGVAERARLDVLADELTPILARYIGSSSNRALVVLAGDHGFTFSDPADDSRDERTNTHAARQGGATPDEVFVPFQAWLVGGVH